jgi:hypothetical protein
MPDVLLVILLAVLVALVVLVAVLVRRRPAVGLDEVVLRRLLDEAVSRQVGHQAESGPAADPIAAIGAGARLGSDRRPATARVPGAGDAHDAPSRSTAGPIVVDASDPGPPDARTAVAPATGADPAGESAALVSLPAGSDVVPGLVPESLRRAADRIRQEAEDEARQVLEGARTQVGRLRAELEQERQALREEVEQSLAHERRALDRTQARLRESDAGAGRAAAGPRRPAAGVGRSAAVRPGRADPNHHRP